MFRCPGQHVTRRTFFSSTAMQAVLASVEANGVTRPSRIIDTHTHFYDPTRPQGVPWPPKSETMLYRPVLPEEFVSKAKPLGVTGTIKVEASAWLEDNQWVLDQIGRASCRERV